MRIYIQKIMVPEKDSTSLLYYLIDEVMNKQPYEISDIQLVSPESGEKNCIITTSI